jgi:hypothetical protein
MNAGGSMSLDAGGHLHERVGASKATNVGKSLRVSVGEDSKEVVTGRKVIDSHREILIRCGQSQILLRPDGQIEVRCLTLDIDSAVSINMKSARIDLN